MRMVSLLAVLTASIQAQLPTGAPMTSAVFERDRIWVGTDGKSLMELTGWTSGVPAVTPVPGLPARIYDMASAPDSSLYLATDGGLIQWRDGTVLQKYDQSSGLPTHTVYAVAVAGDGTVWIGTGRGLGRLYGSQYKFFNESFGEEIRRILVTSDGSVVLTQKQAARIRGDRYQSIAVRNPLAMTRDADGRILIGTRESLLQLDGESLVPVTGAPAGTTWLNGDAAGYVWAIDGFGSLYSLHVDGSQWKIQNRASESTVPLVSAMAHASGLRLLSTGSDLRVLNASPADSLYRVFLTQSAEEHFLLGRMNKVEEHLRPIRDTGLPPSMQWRLAVARDRLGQTDSAETMYAALLSSSTVAASARLHLAELRERKNNATAWTLYREVLRMSTHSDHVRRAFEGLVRTIPADSVPSVMDPWTRSSGPLQWKAQLQMVEWQRSRDSLRARERLRDIFLNCRDLEILRSRVADFNAFAFDETVRRFDRGPDPTTIRWSDTVTCVTMVGSEIWIGTHRGILRVDGTADSLRLSRLTTDSGLAHPRIRHILAEPSGRIWVSCGEPVSGGKYVGGLSVLENGKWKTWNASHGLRHLPIGSAVAGKQVVVLTDGGCYASSSSGWLNFRILSTARGHWIESDDTGQLWLADSQKVSIGTGVKWVDVNFIDSAGSVFQPALMFFEIDRAGNKNAYTDRGIFRYSNDGFRVLNSQPSLHRAIGPEGDVWLAQNGGLLRIGPFGEIRYTRADSLPSERVHRVVVAGPNRVAVTDEGVWMTAESSRDTVKFLAATHDEMATSDEWSRRRYAIRRWQRVPKTADYVTWKMGRLLMDENRLTDAYAYWDDVGPTAWVSPLLTERTIDELAMEFLDRGDEARALATWDRLVRRFSTQTLSDPKQLCDLSVEKNIAITSLPRAMARDAKASIVNGQIDRGIALFQMLPQLFVRLPDDVTSVIAQTAAHLDTLGNTGSALRLYRLFLKTASTQTDEEWPRVLVRAGALYEQNAQYKEAAECYRQLGQIANLRRLGPNFLSLADRLSNLAALGLKTGGLGELNSTNAMMFEGNYLWLGTSQGVIRWNLASGAYKKIDIRDGLIVNSIFAMTTDRDGGKWFAGFDPTQRSGLPKGGVSFYDGDTIINYSADNGLPGSVVRAIVSDAEGGIWVGTHAGISRYSKGNWTHIDLKKKYRFDLVLDLFVDRQNRLWIAMSPEPQFIETTGGVLLWDAANPLYYRAKDGLRSNSIKSITQDRHGRMWFASDEGIAILDSAQRWSYLTEKDGLTSNIVRDVDLSVPSNVWIATNRGVTRLSIPDITRSTALQDKTATVYTERQGLVTDDVRTIAHHPEYGTWFGSRRGVFSIGQVRESDAEETGVTLSRRLFEVSVESEALFERASRYLEQGDYDRAREIYLDVLDRAGEGEWADDAALLLAKSYELEGNYEEAEKQYAQFIEKHADSPLIAEAHIAMGNVLEKQERFADAEDAYGRAIEKATDRTTENQAKLLKEKATVRRIEAGRAETQTLAQQISELNLLLEKTTDQAERDKILAQLAELEGKAKRSAKAGGYELQLYKVKEGDNLWALSQRFLGDANKWKDFFIANEGKIYDPNLILTGQTIVVLTLEKGYTEKLEKFLYYDVNAGEDLETIAEKLYGRKSMWEAIYELNKEKLPHSPKKSLPAGRILVPVNDQ